MNNPLAGKDPSGYTAELESWDIKEAEVFDNGQAIITTTDGETVYLENVSSITSVSTEMAQGAGKIKNNEVTTVSTLTVDSGKSEKASSSTDSGLTVGDESKSPISGIQNGTTKDAARTIASSSISDKVINSKHVESAFELMSGGLVNSGNIKDLSGTEATVIVGEDGKLKPHIPDSTPEVLRDGIKAHENVHIAQMRRHAVNINEIEGKDGLPANSTVVWKSSMHQAVFLAFEIEGRQEQIRVNQAKLNNPSLSSDNRKLLIEDISQKKNQVNAFMFSLREYFESKK
ncbi:MAG: hypothetical protein HWE09_01885 [Cyclobacteriaceae bacterium]|nr:hypothetical protein [Cyclobacteriaceae bacterium]